MKAELDIQDVIEELQRQFPKELTIAAQAVQIRKMQEEMSGNGPEISQESE